jgi:hypothetical protein
MAGGGNVLAFLTGNPDFDREIIRGAMMIWAGRQIEGENPPPIDTKALEEVRKAKLCAWCFEQLGDQRSDFNGGVGHPECARYAYECVIGYDAMPWPIPEPSVYESATFLRSLAREAGRLGIEGQKLAQAIERARRA